MVTPPGALLAGVDRAAFAVGLGERLRRAGVPVTFTALGAFTEALGVAPPRDLPSLYWPARVTLVDDVAHLPAFDSVFDAVFRDSVLPVVGCPDCVADWLVSVEVPLWLVEGTVVA